VDENGQIVDEKTYKKIQIVMDRKEHNDEVKRKEKEREIDYELKVRE
jgi:hypothetical protein